MGDVQNHEQNKECIFNFTTIDARLDRMEESVERQSVRNETIEKAIIEIKTSSGLIAETLAKLESRFESFQTTSQTQMFKLIERALLVIAGIAGALLGVKIL